ncbi:MAG: hypothetical protein WA806_04760 [Bradyrhizobium sp.]
MVKVGKPILAPKKGAELPTRAPPDGLNTGWLHSRLANQPIVTSKLKRFFPCRRPQYQMMAVVLRLITDIDGLFDFKQPIPVRLLPMIDLRLRLCLGGHLVQRNNQDVLV